VTLAAVLLAQSVDDYRHRRSPLAVAGSLRTDAAGDRLEPAAALDAANVRRSFRRITKAAGLGECWTPRELRHSFVSIVSDNGVTIEHIADLVGHRTTIVTQKVYRHQLKPVISTGATAMNTRGGVRCRRAGER
jgi:integrase